MIYGGCLTEGLSLRNDCGLSYVLFDKDSNEWIKLKGKAISRLTSLSPVQVNLMM